MIGYIVGTHYHYDCTDFDEPSASVVILDRADADAAAKARDGSGQTGVVIEVLLPAPLTEDE
jgi:hypothetical protein